MSDRKSRKAHDCIHRSSDIMGHIGKKYTLCLARPVRLQKRVLQQILLLHLVSDLIIHTAQPQDDAVSILPDSGTHDLYLIILHLSVPERAEIHIIGILFLQYLFEVFLRKILSKRLPVFLIYKLLYVAFHTVME